MPKHFEFIAADWPAPANVRALTTLRAGGTSTGAFASLNLGEHVGDDPGAVARNRAILRERLRLPAEPCWLKQVHGTDVIEAGHATGATADGSFTSMTGTVCAVLTADCLPVFLCDREGTQVALLHAGWRGLASGVVEAGTRAMRVHGTELLAWLGPAIGPGAYQVGEDVRAAFVAHDPDTAMAFLPDGEGKWLADMYALARARLAAAGITAVFGGGHCTFREHERFFSFRRDGVTGRMASLIWLE